MNRTHFVKWIFLSLAANLLVALWPNTVSSHCDTMNGPVITAAKKALETGDVNLVLIWVQKKDEVEIKEAFQKTLAVRKLSTDARELADMSFFETLVSIHRAGEGVAYTGVKPAETELDPGIEAADQAIKSGSVEQLLHHLDEAIRYGVNTRYEELLKKARFNQDDVDAGREYVEAYVQFIHYVERLHQAAAELGDEHPNQKLSHE